MKVRDKKKIMVLEVDQWTSTGDIAGTKFKDWLADIQGMLRKVSGQGAKAARAMFGGRASIKEVEEQERPTVGNVWFKPSRRGILRCWKANYDTSG